jgi:phage I-like protein
MGRHLKRRGSVVQLLQHAPPICLDATALETADPLVWIQVAKEGGWKGHAAGEFAFDRKVFEEIVANFRKHPRYLPGANPAGGGADVVPFDFHHVSEADPTSGAIPVVGAPAQAWARELEIRGADGNLQLWALTRYLEPARTYVREGKYQSTSVGVWPDALDPVTGQSIGWYLSSIAFTNDPFIQGMTPITARRSGQPVTAAMYFDDYNRPRTAEEFLSCLRKLFGLTELVGLEEVKAQVELLRAYAAGTAAPAGVQVDELVGALRSMLNLPTLATTDEVFAEVDKFLGAPPAPVDSEPTSPAAPAVNAERDTGMKTIKALLCARLMLDPNTSDEHVEQKLIKTLEAGADAMSKLETILGSLGVEDVSGASAKIAKMLTDSAKLVEVWPELESLRSKAKEADEKTATDDVQAAMTAHRIPENARPAMLLYRKSDPKAFAETYPGAPNGVTPHLLQSMFTHPSGGQPAYTGPLGKLHALEGGGAVMRQGGPAAPPPAPGAGHDLVNLDNFEGANVTQRAMAYVRSQPGGDKLTLEQCHARASDIVQSINRGARRTG